MIIGINFTGQASDVALLEKKSKELKLKETMRVDGVRWNLKGMSDDAEEVSTMLVVASNGHRRLKTEIRGKWTGIYVS